MNPRPTVTRKQFVEGFMRRGGLTYDKATLAYEAMVEIFADAVVEGAKVNIGNVLSLTPHWRDNRTVVATFPRRTDSGEIEKTTRTYHLGKRLRYKVNLFQAFIRDHTLHWF